MCWNISYKSILWVEMLLLLVFSFLSFQQQQKQRKKLFLVIFFVFIIYVYYVSTLFLYIRVCIYVFVCVRVWLNTTTISKFSTMNLVEFRFFARSKLLRCNMKVRWTDLLFVCVSVWHVLLPLSLTSPYDTKQSEVHSLLISLIFF